MSKTSEFYKANPESAENRRKYQRAYNKEKAKIKITSQKTGEKIQVDSHSRNENRDAKRKGKNIKGKQYDHDEGKFIDASKNMSKKSDKSIKFRVKGKKKSERKSKRVAKRKAKLKVKKK